MKKKIRSYFILISLVSALISMSVGIYLSYSSLLKQTRLILKYEAAMFAKLGNISVDGIRITRINPDGTVMYDSQRTAPEMPNHLDRKEIIKALESGEGYSIRQDTLYYALLLSDGSVLRLAVPTSSVWTVLKEAIPFTATIMFLLIVAAITLTGYLTERIIKPMEESLKKTEHYFAPVYEELTPFFKLIEEKNTGINKALHELKIRDDEMRLITSNMREGMIFIDNESKIRFINKAAFELFSVKTHYCIGWDIIYFSNNKKLLKAAKKAEQGKPYTKDEEINGKVIRIHTNPVYDKDVYAGAIFLLSDVTEQKKAEKSRRDFTANISHELKTPLTSIMGYSELMMGHTCSKEDIYKFSSIIQKESQRLLMLINDILKLAELENDNNEIVDSENIDLAELAKECALSLELFAKSKNVSIILEGQSCIIYANKDMMEQLIRNLADNAIRYNKEGGSVKISMSCENGPTIIVEDTGIGIAYKDKERIFERFYRTDKGRSQDTGGTGLGLAIVKHIADKMAAEITLHSESGKGTKISIKFPVV